MCRILILVLPALALCIELSTFAMSGGPSRRALWKDVLTCGVVLLLSGATRGQDDPTTSTTPGRIFKSISPSWVVGTH